MSFEQSVPLYLPPKIAISLSFIGAATGIDSGENKLCYGSMSSQLAYPVANFDRFNFSIVLSLLPRVIPPITKMFPSTWHPLAQILGTFIFGKSFVELFSTMSYL